MKRLTDLDKEKIRELYNLGKMDSEISKELGIKRATIQYYRKTHNMPTKFTYSKISKINREEFEELFNKNLSDYTIASILNVSPDGVYSYRMRNKYFRDSLITNKPIKLTNYQKQVLLGTLLGDSSFKKGHDCINPAISCAHCIKQKEYCEYKTEIFKSLGAKCSYHKRNIPDKRNGNIYEDYSMFVPANPELLEWYYQLYKPKIVIPMELVKKYFTEVSLAFMFMDDGYKINNTYAIATNCFELDNLKEFQSFLLQKFNLETSIFKNNALYIKRNSCNLFTYLISKYIVPCMKYKLQSVS